MENSIAVHIGSLVYTFRHANNLTQKELGKKIGVSQSRVSQIESGYIDNLTLGTLFRLSETIGKSLELRVLSK